MTITLWIIFVLFWLLQPILCYGMTRGYFTGEFPSIGDDAETRLMALVMGFIAIFFGPISTTVVFLLSNKAKHGLKFR